MPIQQEAAFVEEVDSPYGRYHSTFRLETGEVVAQIFERNGWLIAHVSFPERVKPEDVVGDYWDELNRYAKEQGFANKLRIIYLDQ